MGLLTEGISEIIATTRGNAAPIGLITRQGTCRMHLFRGSHTAMNIARDGWVVANFCFDPVTYVKTAFGDLPPDAFIDEVVSGISMQRLAETEAWAAFTTEVEKETPEAMMVRLTSRKEVVIAQRIRPVNRGFNSVIEAAVHGTRYLRTRDPALETLIAHHIRLIRKCGGPREREALELLFEYLRSLQSPGPADTSPREELRGI
jgi:hypothetical protein